MENLAKKIAENIAENLNFDDEKKQIISYGLIAIIQMIVSIVLVFILGLVLNIVVESQIIMFSVVFLRKYTGGAHADTIEKCTLIGIIYSTSFGYISKYLIVPYLNTYVFIIINIIIYLFSFIIIYKLAPVDSPKKPIKSAAKIKRMRRGSLIVLLIYFIISLFLILANSYNSSLLNYGASLLFGVIWQIMTLTKIGSNFIFKLSSL